MGMSEYQDKADEDEKKQGIKQGVDALSKLLPDVETPDPEPSTPAVPETAA